MDGVTGGPPNDAANKRFFFAAPRLAVVDGTHLCLLPSPSPLPRAAAVVDGGEENAGGGDKKRRRVRPPRREGIVCDDNNDDDYAVHVPALPLSSLMDVVGDTFIPHFSSWTDIDDDGKGDGDGNVDGLVDIDATPDKSSSTISTTEIIRLRASDLRYISGNNDYQNNNMCNDDGGGRLVHSTDIEGLDMSNSSSSFSSSLVASTSLRIFASGECMMEGGSTMSLVVGDDLGRRRLEVALPTLDDPVDVGRNSSSCHRASHANERAARNRRSRIYGGEMYGISRSDEDGDFYDGVDHDDDDDEYDDVPSSSIEVHGAGSCLVHDFLGIAGLEQCLVLPRIEILDDGRGFKPSMFFPSTDVVDIIDVTEIRQRGELLMFVLENSFMTDGVGMLLSDRTRRNLAMATTNTTTTCIDVRDCVAASIVMPPLDISMRGVPTTTTTGNHDYGVKRSPSSASTRILTKGIPVMATELSTTKSREVDPPPPPWLNAIARTIEHRLGEEAREAEQFAGSIEAGRDLVNMGRRAIHLAYSSPRLNPLEAGGRPNDEPVIERLRYGVRPRRSDEICGGISATLDFEFDVTMGRQGDDGSTGGDLSPPALDVLHNFHLSCSLASIDRRPPQSLDTLSTSMTATPTNIRTICGVVPTLRPGDCVTILASVLLADIQMCTDEFLGTPPPTVDISIQGLWTDGDDATSRRKNSGLDPANEAKRRGVVLCLLRVPSEMLYLGPPITSPRSGRWIQHEVDFVLDSQQRDARCSRPKPNAIFEYLQPRTIAIDRSGDSSCMQNLEMWKRFVSTLNASVGGNSFVDLHCVRGDPKLKLVIFGSNPEERAVTVKHVLNSLPESAKLINENSEKKENVRALLASLKKEADALNRHRASPSGEITPDLIAEIAALQSDTDGIASTFKQGWI
ncbi:hypothetical protein ACHAXA_002916 [Cyclostephanos tholiformis]|uniref:Uncharacterized protein n=1 Tax=Cyclostephanos tholiformis TaxID=382380 RepID=A0ABD3SGJ7_9STRA